MPVKIKIKYQYSISHPYTDDIRRNYYIPLR